MSSNHVSIHLADYIDQMITKASTSLQPEVIIDDYTTGGSTKVASAEVAKTLKTLLDAKAASASPTFTGAMSLPDGTQLSLGLKFTSTGVDGWFHDSSVHGTYQVANSKIVFGADDSETYMSFNGNKAIKIDGTSIQLLKDLDMTGVNFVGDIPSTFKELIVERDVYADSTFAPQFITGQIDSNGACNGLRACIYAAWNNYYHSADVLVMRTGNTTSDFTVYGEMRTGVELFTVGSTADSTNIVLSASPAHTNTMITMKLLGKL